MGAACEIVSQALDEDGFSLCSIGVAAVEGAITGGIGVGLVGSAAVGAVADEASVGCDLEGLRPQKPDGFDPDVLETAAAVATVVASASADSGLSGLTNGAIANSIDPIIPGSEIQQQADKL